MPSSSANFPDLQSLQSHIAQIKRGFILLPYHNMDDYAGMVRGMMIAYDIHVPKYELDLQWISFGLDLFGENLLENYDYEFETLVALLAYIDKKYAIKVGDIPKKYRTDQSQYPDPIKDADKKALFEAEWARFQADFRKGKFLDQDLKLVYSSLDQDDR